MKKNSKGITQEDIEKAYSALGLEAPELDIKKGEENEDEQTDEQNDDFAEEEKPINKSEESEDETETDDDVETDDSEDETEDSEDETEEKPEETEEDEDKKNVKKAKTNSIGLKFERIEKAISNSYKSQSKYVKALGVMVKAQSLQLEKAQQSLNTAMETINEQQEIIKGYEDKFDALSSQLSELGNATPAPKSVRHAAPIERAFGKGLDDELNRGQDAGQLRSNQVSINNRAAVAEILDQATFAKGYDEEFSKACTAYEAGAELSNSILARIKNEFNIEIVK